MALQINLAINLYFKILDVCIDFTSEIKESSLYVTNVGGEAGLSNRGRHLSGTEGMMSSSPGSWGEEGKGRTRTRLANNSGLHAVIINKQNHFHAHHELQSTETSQCRLIPENATENQ